MRKLWFDVEERYNTTLKSCFFLIIKLWFDVEERYNTTLQRGRGTAPSLWFDVEERYNTTPSMTNSGTSSCGLM